MFAAWALLLPQNVGDVIGAESAGGGGLLDGAGNGVRTVLANQFKQFRDLTRQGAVAVGNVAEIGFQRRFRTESIEESEQPVLGARPPGCRPEFGQFGFESFGSKGLAPAPRTRIADELVYPIVDGDRTGVGLQRETAAGEAMRHAVAIAVELQSDIFVDQRLDGVAIIRRDDRQTSESIGLETIDGTLSRFAVQAPIGDLIEPFTRLAVHIVEVEEIAQRPEVLPDVTDAAAFHFPLGSSRQLHPVVTERGNISG